VGLAQGDAGMARQHGDDHRQAFGVDPGSDTARHRQLALRDKRLHLEQDRPASLERAGDGSAGLALHGLAEELRRVGDADEAAARHLEHAELVRRAEPVLGRAQDAVRVVAIALELEDTVDEVLEHARPRHRAVLRHMADEDGGDARLLRDAEEPGGGLAHLRNRPGRPAEPLRAELHLGDRFLAGDEERPPVGAHRRERAQEQRRLADAGLTPDEHERGWNEPAAEDAVELGYARRDPLCLLGGDVHEAQKRLRRCLRSAGPAHDLLDERPERGAAGALPEPSPRRVAALRARVLDGRLRHDLHPTDEVGRVLHALDTKEKAAPPQEPLFMSPEESRAPAASGPRSVGPTIYFGGRLILPPSGGSAARFTRSAHEENPQAGSATALVDTRADARTMTPIQASTSIGGVMKKILEFGGVAAGVVLIAFGVAAIVLGAHGKSTVASSLKAEQITGTSDMTPKGIAAEAKAAGLKNVTLPTCSVAGKAVNTGSRARCFVQYMRIHALEATGGFVYA